MTQKSHVGSVLNTIAPTGASLSIANLPTNVIIAMENIQSQNVSSIPPQKEPDIPKLSNINVHLLMQYLEKYDPIKKRFLFLDLTQGFKLHYKGPIISRNVENHVSLSRNPKIFHDKIAKEIKMGFTAGPFKEPPFSPFLISPIGLIPKKESNKFRLILDLSYPKTGLGSVNSFIPRNFCNVKYEDFDYVVDILLKLGRCSVVAKTDIESAFNILPIDPSDYWLLGF